MQQINGVGYQEIELEIVDLFCDADKVSIDIGTAGKGPYTQRIIPFSKKVYSFEPHPISAQKMREKYGEVISLYEYAVTNKIGMTTLHVPLNIDTGLEKPGWSSIEKDFSNETIKTEKYTVKTTTIDAQSLLLTAFIKIDVEGAENEVLEGAINTLKRCRPYVLVEMDENHRPGTLIENNNFFKNLNYSGYYIENLTVNPIDTFITSGRKNNLEISSNNIYNFIFIPNEKTHIIEVIEDRLGGLSI